MHDIGCRQSNKLPSLAGALDPQTRIRQSGRVKFETLCGLPAGSLNVGRNYNGPQSHFAHPPKFPFFFEDAA
jgi:hypothetical protein